MRGQRKMATKYLEHMLTFRPCSYVLCSTVSTKMSFFCTKTLVSIDLIRIHKPCKVVQCLRQPQCYGRALNGTGGINVAGMRLADAIKWHSIMIWVANDRRCRHFHIRGSRRRHVRPLLTLNATKLPPLSLARSQQTWLLQTRSVHTAHIISSQIIRTELDCQTQFGWDATQTKLNWYKSRLEKN